jgi:hypothetical protein
MARAPGERREVGGRGVQHGDGCQVVTRCSKFSKKEIQLGQRQARALRGCVGGQSLLWRAVKRFEIKRLPCEAAGSGASRAREGDKAG